jgi:hypothetical protein
MTTNWQEGRWLIDKCQLCPWLRTGNRPGTKTLKELFPELTTVIYSPCVHTWAGAHAGELEFVPRKSGTWSRGVTRFANSAARHLRGQDMKFEFIQLWSEEARAEKEAKLKKTAERRSVKENARALTLLPRI